jgi:oligoribonuclease NrnB/cAMP/cGMP phosphodiesterase (DHH superfamily)
MTFAERHKSAMAEIAIAEGGVDLFYGVDLHSMTVSIRSSVKSKIDCTKVAKMINPDGGGHRNASGASISNWCVGWNNVEVGTFCMPLSFPSRDLPTYSEESE